MDDKRNTIFKQKVRMKALKELSTEFLLKQDLSLNIRISIIRDWINHSNIPRDVKELLIFPCIIEIEESLNYEEI